MKSQQGPLFLGIVTHNTIGSRRPIPRSALRWHPTYSWTRFSGTSRVRARPSLTWWERTYLVSPNSRPTLLRRRNHILSSRVSHRVLLDSDGGLTSEC